MNEEDIEKKRVALDAVVRELARCERLKVGFGLVMNNSSSDGEVAFARQRFYHYRTRIADVMRVFKVMLAQLISITGPILIAVDRGKDNSRSLYRAKIGGDDLITLDLIRKDYKGANGRFYLLTTVGIAKSEETT